MRTNAAAVVFLGSALILSGCRSSAPPVKNADGSTTNPNGSVTVPAQTAQPILNSDGSHTNPDGSVTYPANSPVAEQEKPPNAPAPGAAAPAPAPVSVTASAGAPVVVRINERLSSKDDEVGARFTGVLERPLMSHGQVVFDRGTPVSGEVVASKGKGRFKGAGDLGIEVTAIGKDRVETSEYEKVDKGEGKRTGAFVGGGTGLGALIGGLAGGGKGALIGGLAGAGAGTAGAATGRRDVVIPSETVITFRLRAAVTRG